MGGITTTLFQRPRDPQFNNTTLLLSGNFPTNGAQNNTFLDSSSNNFTITRNPSTGPNATTQGSFTPFSLQPGAWSNFFDGSSTINYTQPALGNVYTIEFWTWPTAESNLFYVAGTNAPLIGYAGSPARLSAGRQGTWVITGSANPTLNAWNHIALVREGTGTNQFKLYLNGVLIGTGTEASTIASQSANIGGASGGSRVTAYISNLRIVNNTAVYTSNFTPPAAPLSSIPNTELLTCQSNRLIDANTQVAAKTFTFTGTPSVQPFSPFAPSGAYTTTAVGGSGYFDGTGDYLTAANNAAFNFGSGEFCVETWFYPTAAGQTQRGLITLGVISTGAGAWLLWLNASGFPAFYVTTNGTSGTATNLADTKVPPTNAWTHIAVARTGNTLSLFVNGSRVATTAYSSTVFNDTSNTLHIAASNGTSVAQGYLAGSRIVKGSTPYDATQSTITIPAAPLTTITNTSLLLNYTNAGIVDSTAKNVLETVGNAQISTTQSRFGGTSMSFDGTNSVVALRGNSNITQFGTGDFTVEMWLYPTTFATYKSVWCCSTSAANATGFHIGFNASGQMFLYSANSFQIASSANSGVLTINTWNHVAVQRTGSTVRIFVNGVAATSTWTLTTQSFTDGACLFGATPAGNSEYYAGFIDDARITRGVARYSTTGFNVPTIGFTDR